MITAKDINHGRILYEQARATSEEAFANLITDKSRPNIGDVLVTKDGTLGRIAIVDREKVCINQSVALLQPNERIRSRFLKYLIEEPTNFAKMLAEADGSTIKHIYITRLAKQIVRVPPIAAQDQILVILSALDDKIDLNRRMNETLEAMAHAVFRDWFVEFGPTRAKAGDWAPYLKRDVWSLFPNQFGSDGLPTGWKEKPLDGIAHFRNGLALQKYPPRGSTSLPVIKIAQLRSGSVEGADRASADLPSDYVVENGDVLFSWSGSLLHRVWSAGRGALNQHLFKVSSRCYPKWFYYYWIGHHMPAFQRIASAKATTMGHIQRHHLTEARVVVPDDQVLKAADTVIGPLFDQMLANNVEAHTLEETRDLILPKLMSGTLGVRGAEKALESAA